MSGSSQSNNSGRYFDDNMVSQVSTMRRCDNCDIGIAGIRWKWCQDCQNYDLCHDCEIRFGRNSQAANHTNCTGQPPKLGVPAKPGQMLKQHDLVEISYLQMMQHDNTDLSWKIRFKELTQTDEPILNRRDLFIVVDSLSRLEELHDNSITQLDKVRVAHKVVKFLSSFKQINILSLDGGGVRGYMPIKLMQRIAADYALDTIVASSSSSSAFSRDLESPDRILQFQKHFVSEFDYIAGTSTGGLIAFALFLEIPLTQLEEIYRQFKDFFTLGAVASLTSKVSVTPPVLAAKYDPTAIHNKLKDLLEQKNAELEKEGRPRLTTLGDLHNYSLDRAKLTGAKAQHLIITSFDMTKSRAYLFNSGFPRHHSFRILDVLYSTMAAPTYFPPNMLNVADDDTNEFHYHVFVDGGIFANDPELTAIWAAYMDNARGNCIYRLFAVGTGVYPLSVPATPAPEPLPVEKGWKSWLSPTAWSNSIRNTWSDITHSMDGGYLSWFSDGGRLINVILEANRSFTETFTAELARFSDLKRYRYNLQTSTEAALDDPTFVASFDNELDELVKRRDYQAMLLYLDKYIKQPANAGRQPNLFPV